MLVQQFADFLGYNIEPVVLYKVSTKSTFFMACNKILYCYINTVHIIIIIIIVIIIIIIIIMLLVVNKLQCKQDQKLTAIFQSIIILLAKYEW